MYLENLASSKANKPLGTNTRDSKIETALYQRTYAISLMEHAVKESKKTQKRADPLEVLPSEVVIQIFNELTFKQCW